MKSHSGTNGKGGISEEFKIRDINLFIHSFVSRKKRMWSKYGSM